jgi:hypothetical protein
MAYTFPTLPTYAQHDKITASDYNSFMTAIDAIWDVGGDSYGYGQGAQSRVSAGIDKIRASHWKALVDIVTKIAAQQGTSLDTTDTTPTFNNTIRILNHVKSNISLIDSNRLNAASQGGSVTGGTSTATSSSWSDAFTITMTADFGSYDNARYFFNGGGQLGIYCSPGSGSTGSTPIRKILNNIAQSIGTVWLSSGTCVIGGVSYNGVSKYSGDSATQPSNTGAGFYNLNSSDTLVMTQYQSVQPAPYGIQSYVSIYTGSDYGSQTNARVYLSQDGAGKVIMKVVFDELPNGLSTSDTITATMLYRPPSTTYLTTTHNPTVSTSTTVA